MGIGPIQSMMPAGGSAATDSRTSNVVLHKRIHELIEEQVERSPAEIAAIFRDRQITYAELDSRANQLARFLLARGLKPEDRVGIAMDRSLDMLVALLGVLKAGCAYVPLDPAYPADRLRYAVSNSNVLLILTEEAIRMAVSDFGVAVLTMDSDIASIEAHPESSPRLDFQEENLAYVMYTSGSTGRPKGVMVRHRNVVNFFGGMDEFLRLDKPGVWLAVTSISFDISVLELLWTLARGFRIVVQAKSDALPFTAATSPDESPGPEFSIPEQIRRHGVTHMQCTPSLAWAMLQTAEGREALGKLEKFLVGGEALPASLAEELHRAGPKEIWNMYGPTETTIWSTKEKLVRGDTITIGQPIRNTSIWVLDEDQKSVPAGVTGELYIGGDGVARGYMNDPELTAQRFVELPQAEAPGLAYRTGDLVRYLPDGRLEFLGRLDHQVKIRGHRVEVGEVEAALSKHPGIREVIVSAVDDLHHGKALVAYLTAKNADLSTRELRSFLNTTLPAHMIPSSFVILPAFPLLANGKIDRHALPDPRAIPQTEAEVSDDPVEASLAEIWRYVMGLKSIDPDDDYFELGGDSLMAVRLMSEINSRFAIQIPLGTLLNAPTIRKMAQSLRGAGVNDMDDAIVSIQPKGSKNPLFCIGPLNGEVMLFRNLALELGTDQPLYGLQPFKLSRAVPGVLRVEDLAIHYIAAIQAVIGDRPYSLLGYSFGGLVAVEMVQQLSREGRSIPPTVLIDAAYPAACKASESMNQRLKRYRYHLREVLFGNNPIRHISDRLRERWLRMSPTLGVPPPKMGRTVVDRQLIASEHYRTKPYNGRIYLFKAESEMEFFGGGPELGWKGTLTNLVIYVVPGDHGTINTGTNLKMLARQLCGWLE